MKHTKRKTISLFLIATILFELGFPTAAWALTGGPSQPEVQSFEPVGTTDMVDLFTGDFNYNIPLLDVEGYPVNLSYHSGISMDQEASWVGLGWNINPGVINRNMRGIPDEFAGEHIKKSINMLENETWGAKIGMGFELFGVEVGKKGAKAKGGLDFGVGIFHNSYRGVGYEASIKPTFGIAGKNKLGLTAGLGISANSQQGMGFNPSIGMGMRLHQGKSGTDMVMGFSVASSYNSRAGLKALSYGYSLSASQDKTEKSGKREGGNYIASNSYVNKGSSINFGTQTFIPQLSTPMVSNNFSFKAALGNYLSGPDIYGYIEGYYTGQRITARHSSKPAFGYLNAHLANDNVDALLDFNREKDGIFTDSTKNLPVTNITYDIYNVSGQGISGMYRPYRSDIGIVQDDHLFNPSLGGSGGVEFALPLLAHWGADAKVNLAESNSGGWKDWKIQELKYKKPDFKKDPLYEPHFFKNVGETTPSDMDFYNTMFFDRRVRLGLDKNETNRLSGYFIFDDAGDDNAGSNPTVTQTNNHYTKKKRDKRNQSIQLLEAEKSADHALDKDIKDYDRIIHEIYNGTATYGTVLRNGGYRKGSHTTEITAYNPDGTRYVYGIAAYNTKQVEAAFSVDDSKGNYNSGQIKYDATDADITNTKGIDNYFLSTELPAYAHSFLLTAVLSADYVDVTGNGISDDDLGTAIKINYSRTQHDFKWRVPVDENMANFDEGFKTNQKDAKGSYLYGEKEMWYVHSIESKNYIAEFELKTRLDGYGVTNENGKLSKDSKSYLLKTITLYAKQDRIKNGENATPVKKVHFEYDYSLCKKAENNENILALNVYNTASNEYKNSGKLTLKKVWFTYGKSFEGRLSPYEFSYADFNPEYNLKGYDRWGNFKPNNTIADGSGPLSNADFPYTDQDDRANKADRYSSAWTLTKIDLPSGGTINVQYESDDYAYVQDKQAMQMFKVEGFNSIPTYSGLSDELFKEDPFINQQYLFFKLDKPLTGANARQRLFEQYIKGIGHIYFNCLTDIIKDGKYEYVRGYAELDYTDDQNNPPYGVSENSSYAWIRLRLPSVGDNGNGKKINPISKTAWQFGKLHTPELIFPGSNQKITGDEDAVIRSLAGLVMDMKVFVKGYNNTMQTQGYGREITCEKSWIRLNNPSKMKCGGGSRVKQLTLSDNWGSRGKGAAPADDYQYGQEFDYTTTEQINGVETSISSGVASYEPTIGNEENPWRQPIFHSIENKFHPDESYYTEEPYGESYFPAPSVGYGRVLVRNLQRENVKRTATGHTVHEFYTSKDYPTIVRQTAIGKRHKKPKKLLQIFGLSSEEYASGSQGYVIELNDMHGKPKSRRVYSEGVNNKDKFISGVTYEYFNDSESDRHLNNTVDLINKNNEVYKGVVGVDMDAVVDMREQESSAWDAGVAYNNELIYWGIFGISLPLFLPSYSSEHTRFNSTVITKVIKRYGILSKVTAYEDGSMMSTENLAFDSETGEVLLTKTQNEYNDPVFNFTYPAHWSYEGMGAAAINAGANFSDVHLDADSIRLSGGLNPNNYFVPGDEVWTSLNEPEYKKLWVYRSELNELFLIDKMGLPVRILPSVSFDVKIIRSGRRNLQNIPVGTVTTLSNPIKTGLSGERYLEFNTNSKVLNAGAAEYSDKWNKQCVFSLETYCDSFPVISKDIIDVLNGMAADNKLVVGTTDSFSNLPPYTNATQLQNYFGCATGYIVSTDMDPANSSLSVGGTGGIDCHPCPIGLSNPLPNFKFDSIANFHYKLRPYYNLNQIRKNKMYVTVSMKDGSTQEVLLHYECEELVKCYQTCELTIGNLVNPYKVGLHGSWHKTKDYVYLDNRNYSTTSIDPRKDGVYSSFSPFWVHQSDKWRPGNNANWTWTSEVTKISRTGVEVENRDALNRYTTAVYGYNFSLPIAVAKNAKYRQIAFEGFEDYDYSRSDCGNYHFRFDAVENANLDFKIKHSGKSSLKLSQGEETETYRQLIYCEKDSAEVHSLYYVKPCDCIGLFSPDTGKYVLSAWVKADTSLYAKSYGSPKIVLDLKVGALSNFTTFKTSGPIIDGWQKIEGVINIPGGTTAIGVQLKASPYNTTYFDDIRLHPFDGNMKSYAYDGRTLKLLAELDDNNYATFYEYDSQGTLIRIKKETTEGIMTIKENRSNTYKK